MILIDSLNVSLHEKGIGCIHLGKSVDEYGYLIPVNQVDYANRFIFTGELDRYYSYNISNIKNDLPDKVDAVFVCTNERKKVVSIVLFIKSSPDTAIEYLTKKFGKNYDKAVAGAPQLGYRTHYIWNTRYCTQIYCLPQKHNLYDYEEIIRVEINDVHSSLDSDFPSIYLDNF